MTFEWEFPYVSGCEVHWFCWAVKDNRRAKVYGVFLVDDPVEPGAENAALARDFIEQQEARAAQLHATVFAGE